jgi:hypothetical protein
MKKHVGVVLLLLQQGLTVPFAPRPVSASSPAFNRYTYVVATNSTVIASITSPSILVTANDLVAVVCSAAKTALTGITASSSGSGYSWTRRSLQQYSGSPTYQQVSWAVAPATGSFTYTCTPNTSSGYQQMMVVDFSGTGTSVETGTGGSTSTTTTPTSGSFSTSQRTLILDCLSMTQGSTTGTWTAGSIAGNGATLIAVNAASLSTAAQMGCEVYQATASVSSVTAAVSNSTSTRYVYDVIPVNY